jgi:hypothetical protein
MLNTKIPEHVEQAFEDLADALQIPDSRYREADARYKSFGKWLGRPESILTNVDPDVYVQGSSGNRLHRFAARVCLCARPAQTQAKPPIDPWYKYLA